MTTPERPIRIGDAERDSAASVLSEHYAAGRLTKAEYDERLEAVWAARYNTDLGELFTDLPGSGSDDIGARGVPARSQQRSQPAPDSPPWARSPHPLVLLSVVLAAGALVFIALRGAPWLLFVAFWLVVCSGFGCRRPAHTHRRSVRQHRHA